MENAFDRAAADIINAVFVAAFNILRTGAADSESWQSRHDEIMKTKGTAHGGRSNRDRIHDEAAPLVPDLARRKITAMISGTETMIIRIEVTVSLSVNPGDADS
jgi:hypothetical protein